MHARCTAAGPPRLGAPRVETLLWTGSNAADAGVPHRTCSASPLVTSRQEAWERQRCSTAYETSSGAAALAAALAAATSGQALAAAHKPSYPRDPDGQEAQVGRKPSGEFANSLKGVHVGMGLRT